MTRLARFREKLSENADAALISSPQNQFYLSDFHFSDGFLLIFADAAYLLTDFRYAEAARASANAEFEILTPQKAHTAAIAELCRKHGAAALWTEEEHLTLSLYGKLSDALEGIKITGGASYALSSMRARKDSREIAAIQAAQALTDAAFSHILGYLKKGVREIDVALELNDFMLRNGAAGVAFDTIAVSGSASSLPHGVPRDLPLQNGFLTMDFGARYGGYCADMTRTVVIGRADEEMRHLYDTVLTAQKSALAAARADVSCRALDAIARDVIDNAGYVGAFGHSLGHGVGIDVHEAPNLSPKAPPEKLLEIGNVITFEPGIYLAGKYGCRIEDLAVVGENGITNLTKSPKELIEI